MRGKHIGDLLLLTILVLHIEFSTVSSLYFNAICCVPASADILVNFDTHHPLVLPDGEYHFQLRRAVADSALREQLDKLKEFIATLSYCHSNDITGAGKQQQNDPSPPATPAVLPPSPPSPPSSLSSHHLEEFSSCGALLLSQKLRNLELQTREMKRSALDPSCLLTPPNTPHVIDPGDLVKAEQEKWMQDDSETLPQSSGDEGIERHYCVRLSSSFH